MTGTTTMVHYADLAHALKQLRAAIGPSEAHGILCGILSANDVMELSFWLQTMDIRINSDDVLEQQQIRTMDHFYRLSRLQLHDRELSLVLPLPSDEVALKHRAQSLGQWAQGYLYGLATAGLARSKDLPQEAQKFLLDLSEISHIVLNAEDSEDNEATLMELSEYVRLGALLMNEILHPINTTEQTRH